MNNPQNAKVGIFKIFGADYINRTADVGWDVFEDFRGKGLGKQLVAAGCAFCFDILALHRLTAEILANNIASLKCANAAGFQIEGTKRHAVHRLGEYIDSLVLGMLVSDKKLALQPKISPV
jgi:RimJ/RimL family protein N-acetyltransferase